MERRDSDSDAPEAPSVRPDITRLTRRLGGPLGTVAISVTGIFILALFYAVYAARAFFLPLVLAVLLSFLLSPVVRLLGRLRVPTRMGALLVIVFAIGVGAFGVSQLVEPATGWLERAPDSLRKAEYKLRGIRASIEKVEDATDGLEKLANGKSEPQGRLLEVRQAPLSDTILNQTQEFLVGAVITAFLLYFLLVTSDAFLQKLVRVLPKLEHKRNAVVIIRRTEADLSRYFVIVTLINGCLGTAVAVAFHLLGMPNPVLWGVLAAFLNFVPYLGGLVALMVVALVAVVSFDTLGQAVVAPLIYLFLNTFEAYAVTPMILGQRLQLNPVMVFVSLIFWGWLWGVPGAILAVPILVSFKIVCNNIDGLSAVGIFLGR